MVDGNCADACGVCDAAHMTLALITNIGSFTSFLVNNVLVDAPGFEIDGDSSLTYGCASTSSCAIVLGQSYNASNGLIYASYALNYSTESGIPDGATSSYAFKLADDLSGRTNRVWGVATGSVAASSVPLPAAAALLPMGLAGLGLVARRRRKA